MPAPLDIAIVGRACVLPGALSPEQLWDAVVSGRDLTSSAPPGRWGVDADAISTPADQPRPDHTWSDRGGYVSGFEAVWDPTGFRLPPAALAGLDPLFLWTLHAGRQALRDAGLDAAQVGPRTTVVMGNLSFPSSSMARLAEVAWLAPALGAARLQAAGISPPDPRNRFTSGLPALLLAQALGLEAGATALDAACASALYAIKLACDRLIDGKADVALAGAVNRADDLFIHVGFCALQAMSKTGRSRPFHADADGLVPAEGCAFVALKRLEDALRDGDTVHGVIRGVGLSNDGRGRGLLAPLAAGQERAIRAAWEQAGLEPGDVGLLECHATGTPVGDGTELKSTAAAFGPQAADIPVGSLKSNLGHLVTVAGVAGLIKATEAIKHRVRPPTLHVERPNPVLADTPFRPVLQAEPWGDRPLRAAVSAFGFGGNNAHVVVEALSERRPAPRPTPAAAPVALVGLGAHVGEAGSLQAFAAAVRGGAAPGATARSIDVGLKGLRFPPADLDHTLAQQALLLSVARRVTGDAAPAAPHRTGVVVGMGCDAEIARYGARWRLPTLAAQLGLPAEWAEAARDAFVGPLPAAGVVGTMPNIPANRVNRQLDAGAFGFTVSAEELSGGVALDVAVRALQAGEVDAVVVGAVDLSCEAVHLSAAYALGDRRPPGDAAVVAVLMREEDARAAGRPVLARVHAPRFATAGAALPAPDAPLLTDLPPTAGHAHAAIGLVQVAAAAVHLADGAPSLTVATAGMEGSGWSVRLDAGDAPLPPDPTVEGPVRTVPAHLPPVSLPPAPAARPPAGAPMPAPIEDAPVAPAAAETMAPAPALPSAAVSASIVASAPPAAVSAPVSAPAPAVSAPVSAPRAAPTSAAAAFAQAHQQWLGQLSAVHQGFLAQQAQMHRQFVQLRQRGAQVLLDTAGGAVATGRPASLPGLQVARQASVLLSSRHDQVVGGSAAEPVVVRGAHPAASPRPSGGRSPARDTGGLAHPAASPRPAGGRSPARDTGGLAPRGRTFSKEELLVHASGDISEIFGPEFAAQDAYEVVTRMPEPPLLLADRVVGLDAEPRSMGKGSIWTETDVTWDAWYLNGGRMPAGLMIESGQADLMLISYLGVNLLAGPDRLYRLLGCKLTYHGDLPKPGETMRYDIHVDGHAKQGDVRLFFFHYDCYVGDERRLSVRGGQAGFFTKAELDDSDGILWTPEAQEIRADAPVDAPLVAEVARSYSYEQVSAFADGRPWEAFGPAFDFTRTHHRTPSIQKGRHLFFHRITELAVGGGPWGRGYLRAERDIAPDDWFFEGHFKNDPCMPGTLMFEGCLQAVAFYMAALGFTIDRDGWRFQPVQDETFDMKCRGQTIPTSKLLVYEIFIEEVVAGPVPTVYADLLCTTDGLKGFHARRIGLQLVPDWPLTTRPEVVADARARSARDAETKPVATHDGFPFDYHSLLACAWGRPSEAFGPLYARFDGPRRVPRLPGPPYHFMSRVVETGQPMGTLGQGHRVVVEYDIPEEAWYFAENDSATMPFCVLLEAALQPCGWLASYAGCTLVGDDDVLFRNLDGTGTLHRELRPGDGTLRTEASLDRISRTGGMTIVAFTVRCTLDGEPVYDLDTVFGFFPPESMANQVGLSKPDDAVALLEAPSNADTPFSADHLVSASPGLPPARRLQVLHRVTGLWPDGGAAGLGQIRGEMSVDAGAWFFKAHFYSDPVQPGSLGVEAMLRLLQAFCVETGVGAHLPGARFEPILTGAAHSWTYRGQVVPHNDRVVVTAEITATGEDDRGAWVQAACSYWVDGKRIYSCPAIGMRVVPGGDGDDTVALDPAAQPWLADHKPTWTVPALAMMNLVDLLAQAVPGALSGLRDVRVKRWVVVEPPVTLRVERGAPTDRGVPVSLVDDAGVVASAVVLPGEPGDGPAPLAALEGTPEPDPYAAGHLFHGPAYQVLESLVMGPAGSSAVLDASPGPVPVGRLNPRLLDGATHAIPHDRLSRWTDRLSDDVVAYPAFIERIDLFGPTPLSGPVQCEARFAGFFAEGMPRFDLQLQHDGRVWAEVRLVEATFPKGPIGAAPPADRRAFLRDRRFVPGVALSTEQGGVTTLDPAVVAASDWLPGTVAAVYGTTDSAEIAAKEHLARLERLHPGGLPGALPLNPRAVSVEPGPPVTVTHAGDGALDLARVQAHWSSWFGREPWPVEDLYYGLIERFVGRVVLEDPAAFEALRGRSVLFLGNHQVGVESLVFSIVAGGLLEVPCVTIAKAEHRQTWLGDLIRHCFAYPDVRDPKLITYFDREDKESLFRIIGELAAEMVSPGRSVMVHVEGTRSKSCRAPVQKMSGAFIDMALKVGAPVVPVRFVGGLPAEPLEERIEFPLGLGRQDIYLGAPLLPEDLAAVPYGDRKERVVEGINRLGPSNAEEQPFPGDPELAARVAARVAATGAREEYAVLAEVLKDRGGTNPESRRLLAALESGALERTGGASDDWLETLRGWMAGS